MIDRFIVRIGIYTFCKVDAQIIVIFAMKNTTNENDANRATRIPGYIISKHFLQIEKLYNTTHNRTDTLIFTGSILIQVLY